MKMILFAVSVALGNLAVADEAPKIEFEETVQDFGETAQFGILTGSFKFRNTGNGVLRMQQPSSSCGCAVATLKKDTLGPGETGEVEFTWKIGPAKGSLHRIITIASNDPGTPQLELTIMAKSRQIYLAVPDFLMANVPLGGRQSDLSLTVTRTDGGPLQIQHIDTSQPWIVAKIDPAWEGSDGSTRIQVEVQGVGVPRRFNESIRLFASDKMDAPIASISVFGEIMGELAVSPERLFWSISDSADARRADLLTRRLTIRAPSGKEFELRNVQSSIKELSVELNRIDDGKAYEIVAQLGNLPEKSLAGAITVETSLASTPKVEVPVEISVFRQPPAGGSFRSPSKDGISGAAEVQGAVPPPSLPPSTQ